MVLWQYTQGDGLSSSFCGLYDPRAVQEYLQPEDVRRLCPGDKELDISGFASVWL